jgi:beta-galactosidase/beta-glucuronidase
MRTLSVIVVALLLSMCSIQEETTWAPAACQLPTRWTNMVIADQPWPEYPRPGFQREEWINLNGLWQYAIKPADAGKPVTYDGQILVPFAVESCLSGVQKKVNKDSLLWYQRTFSVPRTWKNKNVILHFEASDWETHVWINGKEAGMHRGGYDPFSFDITSLLGRGNRQVLTVSVMDPTDAGNQPRGKQVSNPEGIFYTPVTGIWQTVWLEPVPEKNISECRITTDIDKQTVTFNLQSSGSGNGDYYRIHILEDSDEIIVDSFPVAQGIHSCSLQGARLWDTDNPFLYDARIKLISRGDATDEILTYFGMRKISMVTDPQGINRMALNNKRLFQLGPLDQGFWPDGIYTPPTDEAMKNDLEVTKNLGFNMLRKHVKVEPERFYYWCDKLGILVWQDMPSCSGFVGHKDPDMDRTPADAAQFEEELSALIHSRINHPSIIVWVPFNEGWGQYATEKVVNLIREEDTTRLVNQASGWTDRGVGDLKDIHAYPGPAAPQPEKGRISVLGEFGGLGLAIKDHSWTTKNWGYQELSDREKLLARYEELIVELMKLKYSPGLAAAVYTQTTDVETESNGLMTYDREMIKMDADKLREINQQVILH